MKPTTKLIIAGIVAGAIILVIVLKPNLSSKLIDFTRSDLQQENAQLKQQIEYLQNTYTLDSIAHIKEQYAYKEKQLESLLVALNQLKQADEKIKYHEISIQHYNRSDTTANIQLFAKLTK